MQEQTGFKKEDKNSQEEKKLEKKRERERGRVRVLMYVLCVYSLRELDSY